MLVKDGYNNYLKYLRQKGYKEKSIREHKRMLLGALRHSIYDKNIKDLKLIDVAGIIEAGRQHGYYGSQRAVSVFRCYLHYLKDAGIRLAFDWRDIELPKVAYKEQPVLDKKELLALFDLFPLNDKRLDVKIMAYSMRALIETLYATAMRISEGLSLKLNQWPEIQTSKQTIIKGKGSDERIVYFSDRTIYWLKKYLNLRFNIFKENNNSLFINSFGQPLKVVTAKSYLLRYRKKLSFGNKIKFHTLRRTIATDLIEHNVDIASVAKILGHKSQRTTLRAYVKVKDGHVKEVYQRTANRLLSTDDT